MNSYRLSAVFLFCAILFGGCVYQEMKTDDLSFPQTNCYYAITVIDVVDGDTIKAVVNNGTIISIRFLGIDTPELHKEDNVPNEYNYITNTTCLSEFALLAKEHLQNLLQNATGFIKFDENVSVKDIYGRYLCYVYNDKMIDVQKNLLKKGYARVYDAENFLMKEEYKIVQHYAIDNMVGLWSC